MRKAALAKLSNAPEAFLSPIHLERFARIVSSPFIPLLDFEHVRAFLHILDGCDLGYPEVVRAQAHVHEEEHADRQQKRVVHGVGAAANGGRLTPRTSLYARSIHA